MSTLVMSREPVSPLRTGALAGVLTLHLAAFALLALPQRFDFVPADPVRAAMQAIEVKIVPQRQPDPVPPVPRPPQRTVAAPRVLQPVPTPVVSEPTSSILVPISAPEPFESVGEPSEPTPVATEATLAYDSAPPPPYPAMARKRGLQGEVLLRVQVDEYGGVIAVEVEKSSGHRLLDRTAREHVLKRWRFHPATLGGEAVQAWARVPVSFRIETL